MAIIKTLPQKNRSKHSIAQGGFTLVEIMVVLGILAGVLALGVPRLKLGQNNIKKVARELSLLPREVRNVARLKGSTHRIAFKIDEKEPSIWVESASGPVLLMTEKDEKEQERAVSVDEKENSPFQKVQRFFNGGKELPSGVRFVQVETANRSEPTTSGMAYIYFAPDGLVEQSAIQITDGKNVTWTLIVNPLTGHTDIVEKAFALKELESN